MFEKVAKNLSFFSIGVFILGYAYNHAYYDVFNIDITSYISNSEIFYTLLPIVLFIFSFATNLFQYDKPTETIKIDQVNVENQPLDKKKSWIKRYILNWDIFLLLLFLTGLFSPIFFNKNDSIMAYSHYFSLVTWVSVYIWLRRYTLIQSFKGNIRTSFILVTFFYFGFVCLQFGSSKGNNVIKYGNSKMYRFKHGNTIITTSKQFFIIGETQSTLFFYNKRDSSTVIYKRSEIDSLTIKKTM